MIRRLTVACFALLGSCSDVTVRRIDASAPYKEGVRFFRPKPHVLVRKATTKIGNADAFAYEAQLVMLPEPSQEYVIEWSTGFGSINPQFTLEGGWNLTRFDSRADSGVAATLSSLGDLLGQFRATGLPTTQPAGRAPGLYPLQVENGFWRIDWGNPVLAFDF